MPNDRRRASNAQSLPHINQHSAHLQRVAQAKMVQTRAAHQQSRLAKPPHNPVAQRHVTAKPQLPSNTPKQSAGAKQSPAPVRAVAPKGAVQPKMQPSIKQAPRNRGVVQLCHVCKNPECHAGEKCLGLGGLLTSNRHADIAQQILSHLEPRDVMALSRASRHSLRNYPGLLRVEFGAGPMHSAARLGRSSQRTSYTEFRTIEQLHATYGEEFDRNLALLTTPDGFMREQRNEFHFGIDATRLVTYPRLRNSLVLRFTNPNIGNQDLRIDVIIPQICRRICFDELTFPIRSGCQVFTLALAKLGQQCLTMVKKAFLKLNPVLSEIDWRAITQERLKTMNLNILVKTLTHTAANIAACRNIRLIELFLENAGESLFDRRRGRVEIIVSTRYMQQFNLAALARHVGFRILAERAYDIQHEHFETQSNQIVGSSRTGGHTIIVLQEIPERAAQALYERLINDEVNNILGAVRPAEEGDVELFRWGFCWDQ